MYGIALLTTSGSRWNFHPMSVASDNKSGLYNGKGTNTWTTGKNAAPNPRHQPQPAPKVRHQEQPRRHGPHPPSSSRPISFRQPHTSRKRAPGFAAVKHPIHQPAVSHPIHPPPPRVALPFSLSTPTAVPALLRRPPAPQRQRPPPSSERKWLCPPAWIAASTFPW